MRFDDVWWTRLVGAWNASPHKHGLAGFGAVRIEVIGRPLRQVCLSWDAAGLASVLAFTAKDTPRLAAPEASWSAFIGGRFKATEGILRGDLDYEGPISRIYPYAEGFDLLASVARAADEPAAPTLP